MDWEIRYYIWVFISSMSAAYVINQVTEHKIKRGKRIFIWIMLALAGVCANMCLVHEWKINNMFSVGQIVKVLYISVMFFIVGRYAQGGIARMVLSVLIADVMNSFSEMSSNAILYFGGSEDRVYTIFYDSHHGFLQIILLLIVDFIVCVIPTRFYRKLRDIPFEKPLAAKILALGYVVLGYVFMSGDTIELNGERRLIIFYMIFLGIILVAMMTVVLREENLLYRQINRQLFLQEQMQREYVQLLEEQTILTRKFRHDIRKHLDMIFFLQENDAGIRGSGSLKIYESNLLDMCRELTTGDYCSCSEVNAIFYQLEKFCSRNGMDFQVRIRNVSFDTIVSKGETFIFLNAVNWVMEQCDRLKEQGVTGIDAGVELSGTVLKGLNTLNLILRWQEHGEGMAVPKSGARKNPQDGHIQSIRRCLKAYGGIVDVNRGNGQRRLTICWK